jgi:Asp-tRNA(Asn)/Glu-tRNA(Gln) amidotransferase A subunit family amidase
VNYSKDFSKTVVARLAKKGVTIVGATAVPALAGDPAGFQRLAYVLDAAGTSIVRTYAQVLVMGSSSWTPSDL